METTTDAALIDKAQQLFSGFDVTIGESTDETAISMEQYNKLVGELLRRGYSPVVTIQFQK